MVVPWGRNVAAFDGPSFPAEHFKPEMKRYAGILTLSCSLAMADLLTRSLVQVVSVDLLWAVLPCQHSGKSWLLYHGHSSVRHVLTDEI